MGVNVFSLFDDVNASKQPNKPPILEIQTKKQWTSHFNAMQNTNKMLLIDFTARWCGPCKLMDSIVKEIAAKNTQVEIVKVDVDKLMSVSQGFNVQTLPAFVLVKKGIEVDRVVGAKADELKTKVEKHKT